MRSLCVCQNWALVVIQVTSDFHLCLKPDRVSLGTSFETFMLNKWGTYIFSFISNDRNVFLIDLVNDDIHCMWHNYYYFFIYFLEDSVNIKIVILISDLDHFHVWKWTGYVRYLIYGIVRSEILAVFLSIQLDIS